MILVVAIILFTAYAVARFTHEDVWRPRPLPANPYCLRHGIVVAGNCKR